MELFYHATREIEPPRAARRLGAPTGGRNCEACGKDLSDAEAPRPGTYALAFCRECRERVDRSAVQVHFCDSCHVSVPQDEVQQGTALTRDGRLHCRGCRRRTRTALWTRALVVVAVLLVAASIGLVIALAL